MKIKWGVHTLVIGTMAMMGCTHPKPDGPVYTTGMHRLIALPTDAAAYPAAAERATTFLQRTRVRGADPPELAKVSLEVVQLSIECVEPTAACYAAVGKSLSANQLLFAQLEPGEKDDEVRVSVSLFDVDRATMTRTARKVFDTEQDAVYGMRDVVEEATKP